MTTNHTLIGELLSDELYFEPQWCRSHPQLLDFHLFPCSLLYTGYICTYKSVNTLICLYIPVTTNSILAINDYWSIIQWLLLWMVVTYTIMHAEWIYKMKLGGRLDSLNLYSYRFIACLLAKFWEDFIISWKGYFYSVSIKSYERVVEKGSLSAWPMDPQVHISLSEQQLHM